MKFERDCRRVTVQQGESRGVVSGNDAINAPIKTHRLATNGKRAESLRSVNRPGLSGRSIGRRRRRTTRRVTNASKCQPRGRAMDGGGGWEVGEGWGWGGWRAMRTAAPCLSVAGMSCFVTCRITRCRAVLHRGSWSGVVVVYCVVLRRVAFIVVFYCIVSSYCTAFFRIVVLCRIPCIVLSYCFVFYARSM